MHKRMPAWVSSNTSMQSCNKPTPRLRGFCAINLHAQPTEQAAGLQTRPVVRRLLQRKRHQLQRLRDTRAEAAARQRGVPRHQLRADVPPGCAAAAGDVRGEAGQLARRRQPRAQRGTRQAATRQPHKAGLIMRPAARVGSPAQAQAPACFQHEEHEGAPHRQRAHGAQATKLQRGGRQASAAQGRRACSTHTRAGATVTHLRRELMGAGSTGRSHAAAHAMHREQAGTRGRNAVSVVVQIMRAPSEYSAPPASSPASFGSSSTKLGHHAASSSSPAASGGGARGARGGL